MIQLGSLKGFALVASDGRLGTVRDFLFDDTTWQVRWMVVQTGFWLTGRIALIHPSDLGQLDYDSRTLAVRLTRAEIKASPDILLDEPVSRQIEYGLHEYIGWEPEWGEPRYVAGSLSGLGVRVSQSRLDEEKAMHKAPRGGGLTDRGDPHLRSVAAVTGNTVCATDGLAGHIEGFLADHAGWLVHGVVINTGHWWAGHHVLIPPSQVKEVNWSRQEVTLAITRDEVKASQPYNPTSA